MANTTRDSVSDMTVAPTVTVTGSSRVSPSSVIIGSARRVCEASSDPNTTAVTGWYPNHNPTAVPRASGMLVVKRPKMIDRVRARRKRARSISRPAKNMSNSFPRSAKKFATAGCSGNTPITWGPITTPQSKSPTTAGSRSFRDSGGTPTMIAIPKANFARFGKASACARMNSSTPIFLPRNDSEWYRVSILEAAYCREWTACSSNALPFLGHQNLKPPPLRSANRLTEASAPSTETEGRVARSNCYPLTSASSLRLQLLGNCQLLQVAGSKRRCQVSYGDPGAMRGQTCLQQRLCFLTSLLMLGSVLGSSRTRIKPSDTALSAPLQIPHDTTTERYPMVLFLSGKIPKRFP